MDNPIDLTHPVETGETNADAMPETTARSGNPAPPPRRPLIRIVSEAEYVRESTARVPQPAPAETEPAPTPEPEPVAEAAPTVAEPSPAPEPIFETTAHAPAPPAAPA
ncbi:MAG: hypothetical protein ACKO5K_09770, partial [Armatimonadota bacterium]